MLKDIDLGKVKKVLIFQILILFFNLTNNVYTNDNFEGLKTDIKILDKISSKNELIKLTNNEELIYKDLSIKSMKCTNSEFDDNPEISAYIQVKDINNENKTQKVSDKEAEEAVIKLLTWMGEDPKREGLIETPKRVINAYKEFFSGYKEDPNKVLEKTFGDVEGYDDMVIQKNISVQSHCEHHMVPIIGMAHIAYIPKERVVGLSKLGRVVDVFSKRLQTQERLTLQIAKSIMTALDAKGVAVTIDAAHQCMTTRGIKKEKASTVTNYYLGQFKDDLSVQNRYLRLISQ